MEKIYVESKSGKELSFFGRIFNDKGSMISTIIVSSVLIVGLVVFGVSQISYAMPTTEESLISTISNKGEISGGYVDLYGNYYDVLPFSGYYMTNGMPVLGVSYDKQYVVNEKYEKGLEVSDPGLIYLVSNLYPSKQLVSNDLVLDDDVQLWLSQSAVWTYLYEIGDFNNTLFTYSDSLRNVNTIYRSNEFGKSVVSSLENDTFYNKFGINNLILEAKKYHSETLTNMRISKNSDTISITSDNKYYQSDVISIVSSTNELIKNFVGYSVDLSNAPSGTILVDEDGKEYGNVSKMLPESKFYVRVPVDRFDGDNKKVNISVIGEYSLLGAYQYKSANGQEIIMLEDINKGITQSLEMDFDFISEVVSAGVGTVKTIFFMAIILLISGVGIFINAKQTSDN